MRGYVLVFCGYNNTYFDQQARLQSGIGIWAVYYNGQRSAGADYLFSDCSRSVVKIDPTDVISIMRVTGDRIKSVSTFVPEIVS